MADSPAEPAVTIPPLAPPQVGEIWREVDPRMERFIRIEDVALHQIAIRAVVRDGPTRWVPSSNSRSGRAQSGRFNGKRGGYAFVEMPK